MTSLTCRKLDLLICLHFPIPAIGINCREGVSLAVARALSSAVQCIDVATWYLEKVLLD